jgi:hypothetical protein
VPQMETMSVKMRMNLILLQQNYIRKLVELFRTCEDLENGEGLQLLFKIVKGISKLNCSSVHMVSVLLNQF